ncbi:MAG TPA: HsdR family type I site-specific deoxyribonuclease [Candidatus Nanopelagicaceae bacterium]|nr:HsdR family type I site-specific deoxyribonuclease [Candidatus Nanopelagicaceae bacterium]
MAGFTESSTVQSWLIERLVSLGWTYVQGTELPRSHTDVLCEEWLIEAIEILNPLVLGVPERVDEILPKIRSTVLSAVTDGLLAANERMTTLLRGDTTIKFVGSEEYVPLRLIDFNVLSNNTFVVSDEVVFGTPGNARRFDIVLWVNGFPLVVIETKTPVKSSVSWLNGARDIANVYEVERPSFFASNVLSIGTEGRELHYGAVGQPAESWLMWGSTADPYNLDGFERVQRSVDLLLTPMRILSILRDFTLFEQVPGGGVRKLIPRYPQVEAAEAIVERVLAGGQKGLIWHYQGTGKSLLMAFAALMLLNNEEANGPTVVVVLDRLDLIEQIERQFKTTGLPRVTTAMNKEDLRKVLKEDRRGIVLTTIFRFEGAGELNTRENIVVFVDEAHRTQEGTLADDMRIALPNARFFGLTGTPISDKERNTFKLFGDPNDPGYVMNTYSMERSIADGSSVPVHVETRLIDFHLDRIALDEAFAQMADEEELTDEQREFLADKAAHIKTILLNPDRITAVCNDILDHFEAKIAPSGMKAQVVAFDRELVVAYKTELERLIAEQALPHQVAIVMTVGTSKEEPHEWAQYALDRAQEAHVKARFNDAADPLAFLIVTAKLLTGFDAPIEQVQYLDKPLRRHTLFQAITRTNRRYTHPTTGQDKTHGLIVDYIGLGNQIGEALKAADPDTGGARPIDIDGLATEFESRIESALTRFDGMDRKENTFIALQEALQRLTESESRDAFAKDFTGVITLWEFLDPHEVLDRHRSDYKWLAQVYEAIKPTGVSNALLWHRLGPKTLALVHGYISNVHVAGTGLEEVVVDPDAIEAIRKLVEQGELDLDPGRDLLNNPVTVDEVITLIDQRIKRLLEKHPHSVYQSLADAIDRLRRQAITRAEDSIEFLKKALEVARAAVIAERLDAQGRLDEAEHILDPNIGALTQIVEQYKPANTPVIVTDLVRDIDTIAKQATYSGWNESQPGDRLVRRELRHVLQKYALPLTGPLFDNAYAYIRENY